MKKHESVSLRAGDVVFPETDILPGEYFFFPFHMKLGDSELISAAATPLCRLRDGYVFYSNREPGYKWKDKQAKVLTISRDDAANAVRVRFDDEYLLICRQPIVETEKDVYCLACSDIELKAFPALPGAEGKKENELTSYDIPVPKSEVKLRTEPLMRVSDIYREYELFLDGEVKGNDVFLTVDYEGDQAELLLDGKKIADDYYRGEPWETGLKRWDFPKKLLLRVFALSETDPVFTDEPLEYEKGRALRLKGVTAREEFKVPLSQYLCAPRDRNLY